MAHKDELLAELVERGLEAVRAGVATVKVHSDPDILDMSAHGELAKYATPTGRTEWFIELRWKDCDG
jgi:hypothetical protein